VTEKNYSDTEKLQMLLSHWLQHNEHHGSEYLKWAEIARQGGHASTAELIEQAVEFLKKSDKSLEKALESVGGPSQ
jgi:hypothetical protein